MKMKIAPDTVVTFHYRLRNGNDDELENSFESEPVAYLHGHGGIVPGLEREMSGREAGAAFSVEVAPQQGYGPRREDAVMRIQKKAVLSKGKLKPGAVITVSTDRGPRQVMVIKAGRFVLDVDTNHPLAGQTLKFDVEVIDVRAATAEERAHGHVHGPGGHHH